MYFLSVSSPSSRVSCYLLCYEIKSKSTPESLMDDILCWNLTFLCQNIRCSQCFVDLFDWNASETARKAWWDSKGLKGSVCWVLELWRRPPHAPFRRHNTAGRAASDDYWSGGWRCERKQNFSLHSAVTCTTKCNIMNTFWREAVCQSQFSYLYIFIK